MLVGSLSRMTFQATATLTLPGRTDDNTLVYRGYVTCRVTFGATLGSCMASLWGDLVHLMQMDGLGALIGWAVIYSELIHPRC